MKNTVKKSSTSGKPITLALQMHSNSKGNMPGQLVSPGDKQWEPLPWAVTAFKVKFEDFTVVTTEYFEMRHAELVSAAEKQTRDIFYFPMDAIFTKHIPRCYFSKETLNISTELHGFCDTSKQASAAFVYLRMTNTDWNIHVLVDSKTQTLFQSKDITFYFTWLILRRRCSFQWLVTPVLSQWSILLPE